MPNAVSSRGIIVRVIRGSYCPNRTQDLVLAPSFFAIMPVLLELKPIVARALIRANSIVALVLTPAIIVSTLVHIGKKDSRKPRLLNAKI